MSKTDKLPSFVKDLKDQIEVINNIVDIFESNCDHPHCQAIRKFFENYPGARELKDIRTGGGGP